MAVAPTYASAQPDNKPWHIPGDLKESWYNGTVGASDTYVTGGFAISPSTFGLSRIYFVTPVVFSTGHWSIYSGGNIKVFSAAGTELVNASTALQNATFQINVLGK